MDQVAGYRLFRGVTAAMAITLGALSIGNLWVVTLSPASLFDAARGVVLLLVALGLMGEHRLSLALLADLFVRRNPLRRFLRTGAPCPNKETPCNSSVLSSQLC